MSMKNKGENKMDIRKHRFVPHISTTSKIMRNKKQKMMSRQNLNKLTNDN
jgi:hypothetical protein